MDNMTEELTTSLADSLDNIISVLETMGGKFIVEVNGVEYATSGYTKAGNEIILHADVE